MVGGQGQDDTVEGSYRRLSRFWEGETSMRTSSKEDAGQQRTGVRKQIGPA